MDDMEVDQQAEAVIAQLQAGKQLGVVDRKQLFHGFLFRHHSLFNQQVQPVTGVDLDSIIIRL